MKSNKTLQLVQMAMLAAIALVLVLLLPISFLPSAPYLVYDMADVPVLLSAMLFGVLPGMAVLLVVSFIQAFFTPNGNQFVGFLMHFVASGALVLLVGFFYQRRHQWLDTIIGMVLGTIGMTVVMIGMNLLIQPLLYHVPVQAVVDLLAPAIIPFNLIKAGANCILTALLFKALSPFIKKAGI